MGVYKLFCLWINPYLLCKSKVFELLYPFVYVVKAGEKYRQGLEFT